MTFSLGPFFPKHTEKHCKQQNTTVKQWKQTNRVCRFLLVCVWRSVSRNNKTPISLNHVTYIIPLLDIYYQDLPIHWLTGKNYDLNVTLSLALMHLLIISICLSVCLSLSLHFCLSICLYTHIYIYIYIRSVTVHKHDGSVRTSVLTSRFGMVSVQQEEKN